MSRTRLVGILLFLFIPTVLVLYLRTPFGLGPSVLSGIAIMLLHRRVARPFMDRHLSARCFWCGRDLAGAGVAAPFRSGRETIAARACTEAHAHDLVAFARAVAACRWLLVALILLPVAAYLGNALLTLAGTPLLSLEAARWMFEVPVAAAVVGLSLGWPLARSSAREPAIDFPAHNLSLLGVSWTLWVFRVVGAVWLAQAAWAAVSAWRSGAGPI
jgi:hypothetical protein